MSKTREQVLTVGLAVLASLAVTGTTYAYVLGTSRFLVVAPVALVVGVGLLALAVARFEVFVLAVLASRTTLDAFKLGETGGFPDPAAILGMLFSGVAVVWLISETRRPDAPPFSRLSWAALIFVGVAFLGVLTSPHLGESLVEWVRLLSMLLMLLVVERLGRQAEWRAHVLTAIALAAVVPLVVAAYQLATDRNLFAAGGFERIRGTFLHSNPLAAFLALLSVVALALVLYDVDRRRRVLAAVALAAAVTGLYFTFTRAGWLAAMVGFVVVAAIRGRRALLPLLAAGVLVVLLLPGIAERFADLTEGESLRGEPSNSLSWRVEYWRSAIDLADVSPLTGIGLKQIAAQAEEAKQPHNDFVRAYVEVGVAGIVAYGYLVWQYGATAVRSVRRSRLLPRGPDKAVLVGFAGAAAGYTLMGTVMNLITQVVVGMYFYALAGLAVAVLHSGRAPTSHRADPAPVAAGRRP